MASGSFSRAGFARAGVFGVAVSVLLGCNDLCRYLPHGVHDDSSSHPRGTHDDDGADDGDENAEDPGEVTRRWQREHSDVNGDWSGPGRDAALDQFRGMQGLPIAAPIPVYGYSGARAFGSGSGFEWWKPVGAGPAARNGQARLDIGGIVWDICVIPSTSTGVDTLFLATDGGIWKSPDGGQHWTPKTERLGMQWFGAVVVDPADPTIVYGGSGNFYHPVGNGVYKSLDGGETWAGPYGATLFQNYRFNRMVMPAPGVLLAAVTAPDEKYGGLFVSTDSGATFSEINVTGTSGLVVSDVDLDIANRNTVYASVASHGVYRLTYDPNTRTVSVGANLFTGSGAPTGDVGDAYFWVNFAQAPNGTTQYVAISGHAGPEKGGEHELYRSAAPGQWSRVSAGSYWAQGPYDMALVVDPQDPERVLAGAGTLFKYDHGAFTEFPDPVGTWDIHAAVANASTRRVYIGGDSGIKRTDDFGTSWVSLNQGLTNFLVFALDTGRGSSDARKYMYAGLQDTGGQAHRPDDPELLWHQWDGGDQFAVATDPSNPQRAYLQAMNITSDGGRTTHRSAAFDTFAVSNPALAHRSKIEIDPLDGNYIYVDGEAAGQGYLYRGTNMESLRSDGSGGSFALMRTFPAKITAMAVTGKPTSDTDPTVLWVALANNTVWRSANPRSGASATWTSSTVPSQRPGDALMAVAGDPTNAQAAVVVYAGVGGVSAGQSSRHVFRTENGATTSATWQDISGSNANPFFNLPDIALFDVVVDRNATPASIIVASDFGVIRSKDTGKTWHVLGTDMPIVQVHALALDDSIKPSLLRAGTWGRGTFELAVPAPPTLSGAGFIGEYFDNASLSGVPKLTRIDPTIDFTWPTNVAPDPSLPTDNFSVRWTGRVTPPTTERYTFSVTSDDGVRLYLDNRLVIDDWTTHAPATRTYAVDLVQGKAIDVRLEYFEAYWGAAAKFYWSSPTRASGAVPATHGGGLRGEYFASQDLSGTPALTRIDGSVAFSWGDGSPDAALPSDSFSARWTGQVLPVVDTTYTFYTYSDDGVRLWVNGQLIIDDWTLHAATEDSGQIALRAGQPATIRLEYYEGGGAATMQLSWSNSQDTTKRILPATHLSPGGLVGEYFSDPTLQASRLSRIDSQVAFGTWQSGSPDPALPADGFSARWTGLLIPHSSDLYQIGMIVNDGARLWVNGQLLAESWSDKSSSSLMMGSTKLTAGQPASIRIEYYERTGDAAAILFWGTPTQPLSLIPSGQLYPAQ